MIAFIVFVHKHTTTLRSEDGYHLVVVVVVKNTPNSVSSHARTHTHTNTRTHVKDEPAAEAAAR